MSEFYTIPEEGGKKSTSEPFRLGKAYATPLTGFLAGLIVGLLAMYILVSVFPQ